MKKTLAFILMALALAATIPTAVSGQNPQPSPNARPIILTHKQKKDPNQGPKGPIFADIDCFYDNGYLYFDFQRPEYSMMKI